MFFCDAHIHILHCSQWKPFIHSCDISPVITCALSKKEWESLSQRDEPFVFSTFGIHPQVCIQSDYLKKKEELVFLEQLLQHDKGLFGIGEIGFDFYTAELRTQKNRQEVLWNTQLSLALFYKKPLVIHSRKALSRIFFDAKKLKELPFVLFHSFQGSKEEALSFLKKGVNAYYSFGKPLLRGAKNATRCVRELPFDRILFETDAPYQSLKGEKESRGCDILNVYQSAAFLRNCPLDDMCKHTYQNFKKISEYALTI